MSWHFESRRHALASKGIKTAINKPCVMDRFTGANDDHVPVDEVKMEIKPILHLLKVYVNDDKESVRVSLADGVSYKEFSKFHPDIKKKDLIKLFDQLDEKRRETYYAVKELEAKGEKPMQKILTNMIGE